MKDAFRTKWERLYSLVCKGPATGSALRALIREDESAVGYDRNNVRAKAKGWLIDHGPSLAAADVLLARNHFGYLLPMGWGSN